MVRLPATRVRVGDSFAGGCFAVLPIALFDALPLLLLRVRLRVGLGRRLPVLRVPLALGVARLSVGGLSLRQLGVVLVGLRFQAAERVAQRRIHRSRRSKRRARAARRAL